MLRLITLREREDLLLQRKRAKRGSLTQRGEVSKKWDIFVSVSY